MRYIAGLFMLCWLAAPACAEQTAYTVRSTEIKQQPFSDAATVAKLNENSSVNVVKRQGGWVRITSKTGNGWVKMLSLRGSTTATKHGDSGIQSLFNIGRSGSSGFTVATGVRGLSEEDLKNAQPDTRELEKMQKYAVNKAKAERFARDAKLKSLQLDYLPYNDDL
ncbi:MAG: SH3 domain-containing protein [Gallionella sp.]